LVFSVIGKVDETGKSLAQFLKSQSYGGGRGSMESYPRKLDGGKGEIKTSRF